MFKNFQEIKTFIKENDIKMIDFKVLTLPGRWNHLAIPAERLTEKTFTDGIGFDGSSYGYSTIENSDMCFIPDMSTSFVDPYCKIPTLSMIANIYTIGKNAGRFSGDPRYITEKAVKYMKDKNIADEYIIGPEFEFYIFDHVNFEVQHHHQEVFINSRQAPWNSNDKDENFGYKAPFQKAYHLGLPYDLNNDLRSAMTLRLQEMGVDVKYHHHEVGAAGQLEIEVELGELNKMADATMMAKYVTKNEAVRHGKTATFMPKPLYGEAGSGMHVHMLLRKDGKNMFYSKDGYSNLSKEALYFIGGILKHSKALLGFTNPSTNSYKRLVPGFEAPVSICFATGNRSSVIRIPGYVKDPSKRRFEFRPSDATANPYLAYSALLMAGIDGIENKIDPTKEGYGPYDVNVFNLPKEEQEKIESLPKSLDEALEELRKDHEFLLKGEVFDEHFINNWINYKFENDVKKIIPVPCPAEFALYYDL
ncbi:type I glutamate--ammonia ligase [Haloimpatiens sp. FM7330]|uniref:type I glutamate--ammonia ligase n=1 Tax=Haloimpatiens sp. FM7330 TaxID=3298610 RepID=UPI00363D5F62